MKYAMVTVLVRTEDGKVPGDWFNTPEGTYFATDVLEEDCKPEQLPEVGKYAGWAMRRKISESGWPK